MISIIIPTLNEEKYLPRLLDSLGKQFFTHYEIIVADADSTDRTCELARCYGCRVVGGGNPARGRNEGAGHAKGKYLLFLDADVMVKETFLGELTQRVRQRKLDVASGFVTPDSMKLLDRVLVTASNWYDYVVQYIRPHGSGFYIFVRKSLHERIGGFNENLFLAEDHDYLSRAARKGKFAYLTQPRVIFSMRRFDKEGRWSLVWKYFILEIYRAFKKEVRAKIVSYDFGNF
jgi:glycosyltransferase involved in cell wall biosynthesis